MVRTIWPSHKPILRFQPPSHVNTGFFFSETPQSLQYVQKKKIMSADTKVRSCCQNNAIASEIQQEEIVTRKQIIFWS